MMLPRATLTMNALRLHRREFGGAESGDGWCRRRLVQIATASAIASASRRRSRGNTCSTSPSLSGVRETAIGRALMALSLRASSRPIGTAADDAHHGILDRGDMAWSSPRAANDGRAETRSGSAVSASMRGAAAAHARTHSRHGRPAELVTISPSGMPMAMPRSMPAEVKCIQRSALPCRRSASPVVGPAGAVAGHIDRRAGRGVGHVLGRRDDRPIEFREILGELHR